jgi:trans-2-enoyl-CoA reductase
MRADPADLNTVQGRYLSSPAPRTDVSSRPFTIVGNEGVAEVEAVGSAVNDLQVGDWTIFAKTQFGTWQSRAIADSSDLIKVPRNPQAKRPLTLAQAATAGINPSTAYRMLKDFVPLRKGDWFIQNAANSAVGLAAIQLGREWGFKSINIVRDRDDAASLKRRLGDLGATYTGGFGVSLHWH